MSNPLSLTEVEKSSSSQSMECKEQMVSGEGYSGWTSQGRSSVEWQDIHAICKMRTVLQPVQQRVVRKQD